MANDSESQGASSLVQFVNGLTMRDALFAGGFLHCVAMGMPELESATMLSELDLSYLENVVQSVGTELVIKGCVSRRRGSGHHKSASTFGQIDDVLQEALYQATLRGFRQSITLFDERNSRQVPRANIKAWRSIVDQLLAKIDEIANGAGEKEILKIVTAEPAESARLFDTLLNAFEESSQTDDAADNYFNHHLLEFLRKHLVDEIAKSFINLLQSEGKKWAKVRRAYFLTCQKHQFALLGQIRQEIQTLSQTDHSQCQQLRQEEIYLVRIGAQLNKIEERLNEATAQDTDNILRRRFVALNSKIEACDDKLTSIEQIVSDLKDVLATQSSNNSVIIKAINEKHRPPLSPPIERQDAGQSTPSFSDLRPEKQWLKWMPMYAAESAMESFINSDTSFSWWLLTGSGGVGKTRFASHYMRLAEDQGWDVGTLRPEHNWWDGSEQWHPTRPTLIVCDYALRESNWDQRIKDIAVRLNNCDTVKVRLLLIERTDFVGSLTRGRKSTPEAFQLARQKCHTYTPHSDAAPSPDRPQQGVQSAPNVQAEEKLIDLERALWLRPLKHRDRIQQTLQQTLSQLSSAEDAKTTLATFGDEIWERIEQRSGGGRLLILQIIGVLIHEGLFDGDYSAAAGPESVILDMVKREWGSIIPERVGQTVLRQQHVLPIVRLTLLASLFSEIEYSYVSEYWKNWVFGEQRSPSQQEMRTVWGAVKAYLNSEDLASHQLKGVQPDLFSEGLLLFLHKHVHVEWQSQKNLFVLLNTIRP